MSIKDIKNMEHTNKFLEPRIDLLEKHSSQLENKDNQ